MSSDPSGLWPCPGNPFDNSCSFDEYRDGLISDLVDDMEYHYENGQYQKLWNDYYKLVLGASFFPEYKLASDHLLRFLYKIGDLTYGNRKTRSIIQSESLTAVLPKIEEKLLANIRRQAREYTILSGSIETSFEDVHANPEIDPDLWYGFGTFGVGIDADYEIQCEKLIITNREFKIYDDYNWEEGLFASGSHPQLSRIQDNWASKLAELGYGKEYEIFGRWKDHKKVTYIFAQQNWYEIVNVKPISIELGRDWW